MSDSVSIPSKDLWISRGIDLSARECPGESCFRRTHESMCSQLIIANLPTGENGLRVVEGINTQRAEMCGPSQGGTSKRFNEVPVGPREMNLLIRRGGVAAFQVEIPGGVYVLFYTCGSSAPLMPLTDIVPDPSAILVVFTRPLLGTLTGL